MKVRMGVMGIGGYQYTGASCSPAYECPKVSGGDQHPVGEDRKTSTTACWEQGRSVKRIQQRAAVSVLKTGERRMW